jgi:hypothetical protein
MNRREFLFYTGCAGMAAAGGCAAPEPRHEKGPAASPHGAPPRPQDLAYCGVDCDACDVFRATAYGDQEARARAVKVWTKTAQQHWGMKTLDPAILKCRGCRSQGRDIFKGCRSCPIRRCARRRKLASCGLCPDWRGCQRLEGLFADVPQAKRNLEGIAR